MGLEDCPQVVQWLCSSQPYFHINRWCNTTSINFQKDSVLITQNFVLQVILLQSSSFPVKWMAFSGLVAPGVHPAVSIHLERIYFLVICLLCNVTQNTINSNNWEIQFVWGSIVHMSWSGHRDALVAEYRYGSKVPWLWADFRSY